MKNRFKLGLQLFLIGSLLQMLKMIISKNFTAKMVTKISQ